ncbi:MAG: branched-chain amino acid transport system ATP-binding protein [Humisphaera sp.]|nr:branched-chain amino acid transport system ATP-binding protein [Humisphaera sp.]
MLLVVNNLEVCYGVISALQDVSLEIAQGEIVTLIGSNGAGKTTLLRTISGLIQRRHGTISFDGVDVSTKRPHEIVRLGLSHVPEGRQVFPAHTVRENLLLGAYQDTDKARIRQNLDRCSSMFPVLAERREQTAGTLSGGEQQMLAIGRALMARPKLLLLDEPSLGLAPLIVRKIFQIIREINAAGTTVFLVEQNAHMALAIAHRAYVLQTGRVIKTDEAKKLLEDPDVKKAYLGG